MEIKEEGKYQVEKIKLKKKNPENVNKIFRNSELCLQSWEI